MKFLTTLWTSGVLFPAYIFVVSWQWVWLKGVVLTNSCRSCFLRVGHFRTYVLECAVLIYCLSLNPGLCPNNYFLPKCHFIWRNGHSWIAFDLKMTWALADGICQGFQRHFWGKPQGGREMHLRDELQAVNQLRDSPSVRRRSKATGAFAFFASTS